MVVVVVMQEYSGKRNELLRNCATLKSILMLSDVLIEGLVALLYSVGDDTVVFYPLKWGFPLRFL